MLALVVTGQMFFNTLRTKLGFVSRTCTSASSKFQEVFVLGGPGAGKGTQCSKIVEVK